MDSCASVSMGRREFLVTNAVSNMGKPTKSTKEMEVSSWEDQLRQGGFPVPEYGVVGSWLRVVDL